MFLSNESSRRLNDISRVFRRRAIKGAGIFFARLGIRYDVHDVPAFVSPYHINWNLESLRVHPMTIRSFEDIQHPRVRRQSLSKGQPKQNLFGRVGNFGLELHAAGKGHNDRIRVFLAGHKPSAGKKERR